MKKKNFLISLLLAPTLVGCGSSNSNTNMTTEEKTIPTESTEPTHVCDEHDFVFDHSVKVTSDEQGYDVYKCSKCGETENRNFTGLLGELDFGKKYRVLFIGNSYTFFNNSWDTFALIAAYQGIDVEVDNVTNGGWTLAQMADSNDEFGARVKEKLENNKYDVVFIQEQSLRPATQPVFFFDAVRKLHAMIEENGARDVLYETWGRKTGSPDLDLYGMTNYTMTQKLIAAYGAIGEELSIPVSHVGTAFYKSYSEHPEIELYNADLYHPSVPGSYLLSLVHFATVFGLSPKGVGNQFFTDKPEKQAIFEQAAYDAVYGESILDDQYKMSSVGVTTAIDDNDLHIELPTQLPEESIDVEFSINNGSYLVSENGEGKTTLKSTANKSTIMLKNELFKEGGEVSFTVSHDGLFTGYSEQGIILGASNSNIVYSAPGDLYAILGRTKDGGVEHTIIAGSTIMNNIANVAPETVPHMDANVEYRITIKVNYQSNTYKMYVGEDLAMISYSPMDLHGGYIGFSSGVDGSIEVKDIVVNGKYVNVVVPEEITAKVGYVSYCKLKAGDTPVFIEFDKSTYETLNLYKTSNKTVGQIWNDLRCSVTDFAPTYLISDDVEYTVDDVEWLKVSENTQTVVTSNIKFSIGRYRSPLNGASNGNCYLNGGTSVTLTKDNSVVLNSADANRCWGAISYDLEAGSPFTSIEFNYVEDIEITRNDATCNTQWGVQINNPIAGQRCTYNWDGTVNDAGQAKVYYKQNNGGSFTPAGTEGYVMMDTTNGGKTIKMRIAIYSNQMATEPYVSKKTGIITYDAYPYGAEVTDANKLHTQVVKNLSGFSAVPATVNCCPEVINAKMVIKIVQHQDLTK